MMHNTKILLIPGLGAVLEILKGAVQIEMKGGPDYFILFAVKTKYP